MKFSDRTFLGSTVTGETDAADEWPRFNEHSVMEAAVTEAARELQVSQEMARMCAFGAMATACQGRIDVQMPTGHTVPASLMLLTIAESGERKTTVQNYFFEAINSLNNSAHRLNETAMIEHRARHHLWNTQKRHFERMYSKWASQADENASEAALEALKAHVRAEPQPDRSGKFLYDDTTPQALVQMLNENAPNGCLLTSEANSIFSGKALGELDKLNTLWDGGNVIVDRVSRDSFILQNARLSLSLMAQPSVITRFLAKRGEEARGTGFLARFLIAKPRPMAGHRNHVHQSEFPRKQAFNTRIKELLEATKGQDRQLLRFSEQAADLWYRYSQQLESAMQENGLYHYTKDHASKLLENVTRLSAIVHAFERASVCDTEIGCDTLVFSWKFGLTCSRHFREHLASEPRLVTDTNYLVHYLLKKSSPPSVESGSGERLPPHLSEGATTTFTLTQVKQYGPSCLRGRANAERLYAAIELLIKLGHVNRGGRGYVFNETIINDLRSPELKNGEILTIKELPLFSDQEYWAPKRERGLYRRAGYYLKRY